MSVSNGHVDKKMKMSAAANQSKEEFMTTYQQMMEKIEKVIPDDFPPAAINYIKEMIAYTVPGGKMNRGLTVASGLETLKPNHTLSENEMFLANVLGWCVEWLQAFFLVADDIMDGSLTRRGQPCWYKKPNVGIVAINDSFILESFVYKILQTYFSQLPSYIQLVEAFHDITFQTELGQLLDLTTQPPDTSRINLEEYTMKRYKTIVKYKTSYYSFFLPVKLALILSNVTDSAAYQHAEKICLAMGEYFQIQDDFLDCYGEPAVIGKIGTDIQDGKCSWLVVTALHNCNASPEQLSIIRENYAKHDEACVKKIKDLYATLKMKERFQKYEDDSAVAIKEMIESPDLPKSLPPAILLDLFNKIYKRKL